MKPVSALHIRLTLNRKDFQLKINLTLPAQGITVLFGSSGSGKTTVLRCLAGLEKSNGFIQFGDQIWQDSSHGIWLPTYARDIGYVFQEASLFEHMNVRANLYYGVRRAAKTSSSLALDRAIDLLGIKHLLDRTVQTLSGGERQRIAIARALAIQPKLLLMDEPLGSLDIQRRQEVLPWLERIHHEWEIPIVYVTHSIEELTRLANYVIHLEGGSVLTDGTLSAVLSSPIFSIALGAQAISVMQGTVQEHDTTYHLTRVCIEDYSLWVPHLAQSPGTTVRIRVNANDVSLVDCANLNNSTQNTLQGVIDHIFADAHPAFYLVTTVIGKQKILARITRKACCALSLVEGMSVWVDIKSVALIEPNQS